MKQIACFLLAFFCLTIHSRTQKPITLEDIWVKGTFSAKGVEGFNFTPDGQHYMRLEGKNIVEYALVTGKPTRTLYQGAAGVPDFSSYTFSADGKYLLLATATESIYRHSSKSNYFIVSSSGGGAGVPIFPKGKQMYATFSPDSKKVAFVAENDLYYYDLTTAQTVRITTDGKMNEVINGASDWLYEEEFVLVRAFEWSPDSKTIAYLRFDEKEVPMFSMETYNPKQLYPGEVSFKYPKVGEKNARVSAFVFDLPSANTTSLQTLDPEYIVRLKWAPDNSLALTTLNRLQNKLQVLLCDRATGRSRVMHEETSQTYIELNDHLTFLEGGKSFLWASDRDGYDQLYWYQTDGKLKQKITKEAWDMTDFYGIDEAKQTVYFQAAACNAMDREVYKYDLKSKKCKRLSPLKGTNAAVFSPKFAYYQLSHSTLNTPPQYAIYDPNGQKVRDLETNEALKTQMASVAPVQAKFFDFKGPSGEKLNGFLMAPPGVEKKMEKLPLLMFVYGGPGSQQAVNAWKGANYWWFQMLVQQGYAVACVDNRGTGARGAAFKKVTYGQLGKYETEDQIAAARHLGRISYIDPARIGIFGWSYGGYMSSNSLFKGGDTFKAAIAVAPVTNWKWYDSAYTERYMGLYADNADGYDQNAPIAHAKDLKGALLLVHGMADDNVHFQHSAELANELIRNNKQYETMIYPNKNHGIGGATYRLHLYQMMTDFLNEKLKNQPLQAGMK